MPEEAQQLQQEEEEEEQEEELRDKLGQGNLVHRTWGCGSQSQEQARLCFPSH